MADAFLTVVVVSVVIGGLAWLASRSLADMRRLQARNRFQWACDEWHRLMNDERWDQALEYINTVEEFAFDANLLSPYWRWLVANNRAWCCVELGRGADAVALAEHASRLAPDESRAYGLGTLGAAYQVAGRSAEAARLLKEALSAVGDIADSQAARGFYLGEALRALGRVDEARAAYQRAVDESAASPYGRRASQQLDALPTAPHR